MKKWQILGKTPEKLSEDDIIVTLLANRGLQTKKAIEQFLHPTSPWKLTAKDVGIDPVALKRAVARIHNAIKNKESIVVYADYDADGITAGAIMWEALYGMGAQVMPYIPHRVEEGYGLSQKGIDAVQEKYHPSLIITVDHGITAKEKVAYAKSLGIEVIITDHHVKPAEVPDCTVVHTTTLCGAGVSWFVAKEVSGKEDNELVALASIGTIADLVPLVGANRSIVKYGLAALNHTKRVGLIALVQDAGLTQGEIFTYNVSHVLAPRLNAMGRLVHAMDALRLLCTKQEDKAIVLARQLGLTNKERQQMTIDMAIHAKDFVSKKSGTMPKLLFVSHESYNQGVIGLVAGKLVEEYYRPSIVIAKGELISKASARSISGFNIVEAIRSCSDLLIDVGGHPMAAGFTVETKHLDALQSRLEELAQKEITDNMLVRQLHIDMEIPFEYITPELWERLREFEPFGLGSSEPVFTTKSVTISDARLIGADGKHVKLFLQQDAHKVGSVGFGMGSLYPKLKPDQPIDVAYTIDMNEWNGNKKLQLKLKDIHFSS